MAHESAPETQYLVEIFAPRCTLDELEADAGRIRTAAQTLSGGGDPVRLVRSLLVPREETAFHFFEAARPEAVEHALHGAGLDAERISLTIAAPGLRAAVRVPSRVARGDEGDA